MVLTMGSTSGIRHLFKWVVPLPVSLQSSEPAVPANKAKGARCGGICRGKRSGAGGAKGGDQGEYAPAQHALDSEPDSRGTGAGVYTASTCRDTPEVGAVCGKAARTVLGGGRAMKRCNKRVMASPQQDALARFAEANQEQWHAFTRKRRSHNIGYFRYFLSLIFHEPTEQIFPDCANPCTRFDPSALLLSLLFFPTERRRWHTIALYPDLVACRTQQPWASLTH
jgi:hypothetical protein